MHIKFDIPQIQMPDSEISQYWLKSIFIRSASTHYHINALTSTYVRLVEASLIEYQSGEARLREFWGASSSLNLRAMHQSMSHFEACLSNIYRAINCYRRLRRDKEHDPISRHLKAEKAGFATDAAVERFRAIRNAIHHLEAMVVDGTIAEGQPFMLSPDGPEVAHPTEANQTIKTIDRLTIGGREVRFAELAALLTEMSKFAATIADFLPSNGQAPLSASAA
jgi:hypothetical protein